jgi:hypothetical protein
MRRPALALAAFLLSCVAIVSFPDRAAAAPVVISFDAALNEPALATTTTDLALAVAAGQEITRFNATNIGSLFFDDEYVDVSSTAALTSVDYRIQGGGGPHPVDNTYTLTGWTAGANLVLSNFVLNTPGTLVGVAASASGVIGTAGGALMLGADYLFTTTSLTIFLADLGIAPNPNGLPLGTMTFALQFQPLQNPNPPVPEPATLGLLGAGLVALVARRRCSRS